MSHLHEDLNHVLHTVADCAFVQDSTETLEDGSVCFG